MRIQSSFGLNRGFNFFPSQYGIRVCFVVINSSIQLLFLRFGQIGINLFCRNTIEDRLDQANAILDARATI
jgi:hypothetical protein